MKKWRNIFITVFVILWCLLFHYESVRFFYLQPVIGKSLPKIKFLFPPAGWIMFYRVDNAYGHRQILGIKDQQIHEVDPHEVFRVRTIGYDNIHRGVISAAAAKRNNRAFCQHLYNRFEDFDDFRIIHTYYPDFIEEPYMRYQQVLYNCSDLNYLN